MRRFVPNPPQQFVNPSTGARWVGTGPMLEAGIRSRRNPKWQKLESNYARLFVGLSQQIGYKAPYPEIDPKLVYDAVEGIRTRQAAAAYGASFITQLGHWIDEETGELVPETSLQIIIYYLGGKEKNWTAFKKNIKTLAEELLFSARQKSIIVEYVRDGRVVETKMVSLTKAEQKKIADKVR